MSKPTGKSGVLAKMGMSARRFASQFISPAKEIDQGQTALYGAGITTVASLLNSGKRQARARQIIYDKWAAMEGDPIVSTALLLLVTSALGGSETSGDIVFIEPTADAKKHRHHAAIVTEIAADLTGLFNRVAFQMAYTGSVFGDAYARIYTDAGGVRDLYTDELVRPPLVQPFERGGRTVGYALYVGKRNFERLDIAQMARLKMPRTQWVPQFGVVEKSMRLTITEDDLDQLPIMPGMVGGSLLYNAEEPWDNLNASLLGLVGQRWMDSIDEQVIAVNMESMTVQQRKDLIGSIAKMLEKSRKLAEDAVKSGHPVMSRIRHILPFSGEKQLINAAPLNGGAPGRSATISIDDVILHARLLSGALGVDLSMIGFADQMSGGLGEGGFFRASAQAAERARIIRIALEHFFNQVIDIHTLKRYGFVYPAHERPWDIQFYGSISALEAERQRTRLEAMNAGAMLAQNLQVIKELGMNKEQMTTYMTKTLQLDEDEARVYAGIADAGAGEPGAGMEDAGDYADDEEPPTLDDARGCGMDSASADGEPVFTQYRHNAKGAIAALKKAGRGVAIAALYHPDIGDIDLRWGETSDNPRAKGAGLAKIIRWHPEVLHDLQSFILRMKVHQVHRTKREIHLRDAKGGRAGIKVEWDSRRGHWLMTAYIRMAGVSKSTPAVLDSQHGLTPAPPCDTSDIIIGFADGLCNHEDDQNDLPQESTLDGIGQMTSIPIPQRTVQWLGFDGAMTLRADLHALAERHTEYYEGDPDAVLADIQFVLKQPDDWFIHSGKKVAIFREMLGTGRAAMVRIEMEISGKTLVVRSVFQGGKRQIATKMNERKRELKRLGLGSLLPGSLSVAEYLEVLGNRSLRAVPPSGGSPKA